MDVRSTRPLAASVWAFLCVFLFAAWQFISVHANYDGNWTGLFCVGEHRRTPPSLARGTWIFRGSDGYDGQYYRDLAHDPWLTGEAHDYLDGITLRARRILIPALAWVAALGRDSLIDGAYIVVVWIFVFTGCYWTAAWLQMNHVPPSWSLAFLFVPATLIAMDRLTIDVATAALTMGFVYYWTLRYDAALYAVCAAAGLSRETGALLPAALVAACLFRRQWKRAAIFASTVLWMGAWYAYVAAHDNRRGGGSAYHWLLEQRTGPLYPLFHPISYALPPAWNNAYRVLDCLALLGMLASFVLGLVAWWRNRAEAPRIALLLSVLSVFAVLSPWFWMPVYGYARPFSPLLLLLACEAVRPGARWVWLLPMAMVDPRIILQLCPQLLATLRHWH